jgi:transposase
MYQRTSVGLDVHARSVVACGIDGETGEVFERRSRAQGPITKTGNGHVRRLLVEAAWHHRSAYRPSVALRRRWDQASPAARARGHTGNRRLHAHWQAFDERHKRVTVANAAIARELAGWC